MRGRIVAGALAVLPLACTLNTSGSSPATSSSAGGGGPGGSFGFGGGGSDQGGEGGGFGGDGGFGGFGGFGGAPTVCGDGSVDRGEACDDDNDLSGDGCDDCELEHGWGCTGEPSECATDCGDGVIAVYPPLSTGLKEQCDDEDAEAGDGCDASCQVENGWECQPGEPSVCTLIQPITVTLGPGLNLTVPDDAYDGTLATMQCVVASVPGDGILTVASVRVTIGMSHPFVGDLVAKVQSAEGTITTLFSRPGHLEPNDDGTDHDGGLTDSSNLTAAFPLLFYDGANDDAELLGDGIDFQSAVCEADGKCEWDPNNGAGPGPNGLAELNGELPNGTWRICVGDANNADVGVIDQVVLRVESD